jgi:hypothetical protein
MEEIWVLVPISGCAAIFLIVYYLRRFQNVERLAMIEKGVDPSLFTKRQRGNPSGTLRASLLLIGAGLGFLIGYFLDQEYNMQEVGYFSMLFIFGGLGLGAAYFVEEKKIKEELAKN